MKNLIVLAAVFVITLAVFAPSYPAAGGAVSGTRAIPAIQSPIPVAHPVSGLSSERNVLYAAFLLFAFLGFIVAAVALPIHIGLAREETFESQKRICARLAEAERRALAHGVSDASREKLKVLRREAGSLNDWIGQPTIHWLRLRNDADGILQSLARVNSEMEHEIATRR